MSVRRMIVSPEIVKSLLLFSNGPYRSDLPKDIQIRDVRVEPVYRLEEKDFEIVVYLESSEWESAPEGHLFPIINPIFTLEPREEVKPVGD